MRLYKKLLKKTTSIHSGVMKISLIGKMLTKDGLKSFRENSKLSSLGKEGEKSGKIRENSQNFSKLNRKTALSGSIINIVSGKISVS